MSLKKEMDHGAYQKKLRYKSIAELHYLIKDAGQAAAAYPEGINAGYYTDEVHYAAMELKRREDGQKKLVKCSSCSRSVRS